MQLFPSIVEEVVFWVVYLITFIGTAIWLSQRHRQYNASSKKSHKDPSGLICAGLFPLSFIAIWLGYARIGVLPSWLFYPGLTLFVLGVAFSVWAYHTLGRFFALTVQAQPEHRVVDQGPYRFIRHPGYTGILLAMLGLGLAMQSWAAILILLLVSSFALIYRVRIEERFLLAEIGNDYVEYCKRTKRIIPFIF